MSLYARLQSELKQAMLQKQEAKRDTLRMLVAACKNQKIELGHELDDEDVINVLVKERKTRQESAEQYRIGGREDLVTQEESEIEIIKEFLPAQMSVEEIKQIVFSTISELGVSSLQDMGSVMGALKLRLQGKADMKLVSQLVKEALG